MKRGRGSTQLLRLALISAVVLAMPLRGYSQGELGFRDLAGCIHERFKNQESSALIEAETAARQALASFAYPSLTSSLGVQVQKSLLPASTALGQSASVSLNQQIVNFSQWARISARNRQEEAAGYELEARLFELMSAAITPFHSYVSLSSQEAFQRDRLVRLDQITKLTRELTELKVTDRSELYALQADLATTDLQLKSIEIAKSTAIAAIRVALGVDDGRLPSLKGAQNGTEGVLTEAQLRQIVEHQSAVKALSARLEASQKEANSARLGLIPSIAVSADYSDSSLRDNSTGGVVARTRSLGFAALLSFPLFDQGLRQIEGSRANAQSEQTENRLLQKKNALFSDLSVLSRRIKNEREIVDLAEKRVELLRKGFQAAWTLFSVGKKTFVWLKNSEENLTRYESELADAKSQLAASLALLWLYSIYQEGRASGLLTSCAG